MKLSRRSTLKLGGASLAGAMLPAIVQAKTFINIATASATSTVYPVGIALAEIFNDGVEDMAASAITTGGTLDNMNQIASGEADIAFANSAVAENAYSGEGAFEGHAVPELRGLFTSAVQYAHLVSRADSGVASVRDLKGKRFVPGGAGSGSEAVSKRVLAAYGLSYDDMDVDFVAFSEAAEKLKNNQADAAMLPGAVPLGAVIDVSTSADVRLVPIDGPEAEALAAEVPAYFLDKIPAGSYRGQDVDVQVIALSTVVVCNAALEADLVSEMLESIFANLPRLATAHASMKALSVENAVKGMTVPWHDGAVAYFKSRGIDLS